MLDEDRAGARASLTQLTKNRRNIEATGAVFQSIAGGKKRTRQTAVYRYTGLGREDALSQANSLVKHFPESNRWRLTTEVNYVKMETVERTVSTTKTVPGFSIFGDIFFGGITDAALGGIFQYTDDLQNPYFTPRQRIARATVSGVGGALFSYGGSSLAATFICGAVPVCLAAGGLVGGTIWAFGFQPMIFENIPGFQADRDLAIFNP